MALQAGAYEHIDSIYFFYKTRATGLSPGFTSEKRGR